ncbi:multifunctional 2',3'-cyclic-nucleotide 2'-phosphodiesterase/3'-nucleotidase/5'-nucleotidase [Clostridium perfringens]|uniref:multifunctional 2',3'-cyclic-nucleotide 2'-phosphodiesterase/3'-nucleotidase/5'-nucleotidase n=1 Tax=Clostridium perfringens TaxID=1502 RepID=UPI001F06FBA3|nr:multifunctional 2',3'-cyclic-nucleotide 2'-phosphodiesterase/3'-nucleotidase/5'-nucleotidase [Clostridium perfringens]MCX0369693.1 multifunctional 2',3'-cyclic-nucleotide 2'-phosphodiesterase/3'-nucleotidase/5'-nucleotidase [Clostridium perfringens]MDM0494234.1 multifunctional 2',3'-cyclic-nucleotide 2'-phosphodiesterase/3'-nucleotidase/5'-nucleotidase [Clostridium perfringens]
MLKKVREKKFTALAVATSMIFGVATPLTTVKATENLAPENLEKKEESTLEKEGDVTIQILGTSDLHGRFMNYEYARNQKSDGGLNQISTLVNEARKENPNTIVVDNGDTIQGNFNHLFKNGDNPMVMGMNAIGYDVFSLGNHEFNYGMDNLNDVVSQANDNLDVLCANLYKDGKRVYEGYTTREIEGVEVALIGVVSPHIMKWDSENLKGYEAKNPAEEVGFVIDEIENRPEGGADVYAVVSHVGLESEYGNGDSARAIAEMNPEVSAIVAGHSHTNLPEEKINNAVISQPTSNGQMVSKIELTVRKNGEKVEVVDKKSKLLSTKGVAEDQKINDLLANFHNTAIADATAPVGEMVGGNLADKNEIKEIPQSLVEDQGITDFINEVQLYNSRKHLESKNINPDEVYMVSGAALFSASSNLYEGNISKADISNIYRYDNKLYTIKTNGKQLKKYMEKNTEYYNTYKDGDLTVSFNEDVRMYLYDMFDGISYEINISKEPGQRIENLKFEKDGKPVEDSDVVYLTVNDYRYNSGLAAGIMDQGEHEKIYDTNNDQISDMRDLIVDYIQNVKGGKITKNVDNNWKITGNDWDSEQRELAVKLINEGKIKIPVSEDGRTPNVKAVTWNDVLEALGTKEVEIPIVTFNDFHGSLAESKSDVGAAKLVGEIKRVKEENPNTVVVTGGDIYQGSAMSNLLKGEPVTAMLKEMGLEFSAVGNHEFDWGYEHIPDWAKAGEFDFLASNIYEKETGEPVEWAKPYGVVEREGKKVGFIGLATPETAYKTKPDNVAHLEFKDPVEATKIWVNYLENEEKVDAVVVLSHLGSEQNRETGEITGEIVEVAEVPGVDAIISAHSHQKVEGKVNGVPVIQAYKNGRNLGYVNLKFDDKNELVVTTKLDDISKRKDTLPVDKNMEDILAKFESDLAPIMNEKVTDLSVDLPHNRDTGVSPMGATVAETMRRIVDADIAITNGGGVRAPLMAGTITVGDMYTILPFDNTLVTMEMKGSDIIKVLEHGIEPDNFGWGQHAGVKIWYTPGATRGEKITSVRLADGTKLENDKYYTVVTNDFMAVGGDSYDFSAAKNIVDTNLVIRDEMANYWRENGIDPITDLATLLEAGEDTTVDSEKPESPNNGESLPNTGMPFGTGAVAAMGTVLTIGGLAVLRKKKNNAA